MVKKQISELLSVERSRRKALLTITRYNAAVDEIAEQFAVRDRFLRKLAASKTPDELMREMWRMQQASWETLQRIPQAWDAYKRQQFKKRAIDVRPEYFQ